MFALRQALRLPSVARAGSSTSSSITQRTFVTSALTLDNLQTPGQIQPYGQRDLIKEQEERAVHPVEADLASDAPAELRQRSVRIFKPAKTANSSGRAGTSFWRVDFDVLQGSARWQNPLMGWDSSADYMQGTFLKFKTKEDAVFFCEKQGWPYHVQEPHKARIPPKSYAANYSYQPLKLRIHHTK